MKKLLPILLLASAPLLCAGENLLEGVLSPVDGTASNLVSWSELRGDQLTVEGDSYLLSNVADDSGDVLSFRTKALPPFGGADAYLFSVEVRIRSMERRDTDGDRKHPPQGLMLYFHQENGPAHRWAAVSGNVTDSGWIKVVIPIDLVSAPELAKAFILATIRDAKAEIELRNFSLEVDTETGKNAVRFILPGELEIYDGPLLRL